jgi:membrane protease YdiL (CAAX protease family)
MSLRPADGSATPPSTPRPALDRAAIAWGVLVFALLALGLAPLYILKLDLGKLAANSSGAPPIALVGIVFTAYTPALAALLIAWLWPSAGGVRSLLKQMTLWRVHIGWYALALLGPIPLLLLADAIYVAVGGAAPSRWLSVPGGATLAFAIGGVIAGSVGEELGWRGFGQPRLQSRYGALWAALVVGILWSTWHLWPVAVPGGWSLFTWTDIPQTYVRLTSTAVLYAWLYNSTRGSLFLVMVAHAGYNIGNTIVGSPSSGLHEIPIIVAALHAATALVVIVMTNRRTLTRSRIPELLPANSP